MRVYKYMLKQTDEQRFAMPRVANLLSVAMQGEDMCLWALVDEDAPSARRTILIHGTGHELRYPTLAQFVGTIQMYGGSLVFHVFSLPEEQP